MYINVYINVYEIGWNSHGQLDCDDLMCLMIEFPNGLHNCDRHDYSKTDFYCVSKAALAKGIHRKM